MCLRRILDHDETVASGDLQDRIHVRRLSVEMDGNHRHRPGRDRRLELRRIQRKGNGIDIHEDRCSADVADRGGRRDEGERHCDDLVAGAHPRGEKRQVKRAGSRVHRDAVRRAAVVRELRLEALDLAPEHVGGVRQNAGHGLLDLSLDFPVLRSKIDERNHTWVLAGCARAAPHLITADRGAQGRQEATTGAERPAGI